MLKNIRILIIRGFLFFICLSVFTFMGYAQDQTLIDHEGLQGEELICIARHPKDENMLFIGTNRGLYKKSLNTKDPWKRMTGLPSDGCKVNQILLNGQQGERYIATEKGLFVLAPDLGECRNIFARSDPMMNDCLSVCVLTDGSIFAGTRGGLFFKKQQEKEWTKITGQFDQEEIISLYAAGQAVYVAIESGVYKSEDKGMNWEKIFNTYSYQDAKEVASDDSASDERGLLVTRQITGSLDDLSTLYVVTKFGIFMSQAQGKKWMRLPLDGLDTPNLKFMVAGLHQEGIFAVAKSGVYRFKNNQWQHIITGYDGRQIVLMDNDIILITSADIIMVPISRGENSKNVLSFDSESLLKKFDYEPTVEEVQIMAIQFAEVSNEKIKSWRRRANVKAVLPTVSVGLNNNIFGSSSGAVAIGPNDWDVRLSWNLSDLIYNGDQTLIDTRSKLMVEMRNDILAEVTRVYFERRKLQIELVSNAKTASNDSLDKKLRLMELTGLLDRLTGGCFSKSL